MSMDDSLSTVQKLYEEGYVTYPRTNSEYLATAEQGKMKTIIANVAKLGYPIAFRFSKSIFDDSKIESHSALTPTYKIPDPKSLSEREKQVYTTILRRFVAVCIFQITPFAFLLPRDRFALAVALSPPRAVREPLLPALFLTWFPVRSPYPCL